LAKIQETIEINPEDGANLGYMYLNCIDKRD